MAHVPTGHRADHAIRPPATAVLLVVVGCCAAACGGGAANDDGPSQAALTPPSAPPDDGGVGDDGGAPGDDATAACSTAAVGPTWTALDTSVETGVPGGGGVSALVVSIRVDPRDANVVYVGTLGGGVWKSAAYTTKPVWSPITDGLDRLDVGAIDLDPQQPDTIYVGLGADEHAGDSRAPVTVAKSTDGGQTWLTPAPLDAGSSGGNAYVRELRVDPTSSAVVLAATKRGIFRSADAGHTFAPAAMPTAVEAFQLVYLGSAGAESAWLASGLAASGGTDGDLYRSVDSGRTWQSARVAGAMPLPPGGIHRLAIAAGHAADPTQTTVYAVGEIGSASAAGAPLSTGFFRSTDGGVHFTQLGGELTSPSNAGCAALDEVGGSSGGTNVPMDAHVTVAVDPTDDAQALFAGPYCTVRMLDGLGATPTWTRTSQWFQSSLSFVHADVRTSYATNAGGTVRMFTGTDGGVFDTANLFTVPVGSEHDIVWRNANQGLRTLLAWDVGSSDPSRGGSSGGHDFLAATYDNAVVAGVTDATGNVVTSAANILGGDGTGSAINEGTLGTFYWGANQGDRSWCTGNASTCLASSTGWKRSNPAPPSGDADVFFRWVVPDAADPTGAGFLTNTQRNVWRSSASGAWSPITGTACENGACTTGNFAHVIHRLQSSAKLAGVYGAVLDGGRFAVTNDGTSAAPTWSIGQVTAHAFSGEGIALPASAPPAGAADAGGLPGDAYVVTSSSSSATADHVFATKDRGKTFTPLRGAGPCDALPPVAAYDARYDPSDATSATIYVATDVGVYRTTDGGAHWSRYGAGLPRVRVYRMFLARDGSLMRIATYGRGIWQIRPH